jgi:hypothetical protein
MTRAQQRPKTPTIIRASLDLPRQSQPPRLSQPLLDSWLELWRPLPVSLHPEQWADLVASYEAETQAKRKGGL